MATKKFIEQLSKDNGLTGDDLFEMHRGGKSIPIITRMGIEKIQARQEIDVVFEVVEVSRDFAVVKAHAEKGGVEVETFGSALHGQGGNCQTNYVVEMAEKRALSRAVLKVVGAYSHGVFGQDESPDFVRDEPAPPEVRPDLGARIGKEDWIKILGRAEALAESVMADMPIGDDGTPMRVVQAADFIARVFEVMSVTRGSEIADAEKGIAITVMEDCAAEILRGVQS